jgi:RNA polymerase sigma factor (sigma-70 family)
MQSQDVSSNPDSPPAQRTLRLFHFCRMQLPGIGLSQDTFTQHLRRTKALFDLKQTTPLDWEPYCETLYALDWYITCGCLEGKDRAWEYLFGLRTGRQDCLLLDALRARATRLYPRDEERQENAVDEFWSHLLVPPQEDSLPILARYDGQRPLAPWLIRVFQNHHVSMLRSHSGTQALPEEDVAFPLPVKAETRWHEVFCQAARDWLKQLPDKEMLLLGLRWRYKISQREVAKLIGKHEGTISKAIDAMREECLTYVGKIMAAQGWSGDSLDDLFLTEMAAVLMDEPRLSADALGSLLSQFGIRLQG